MICKLCQQQKPLIKAHIIPDFMYRGLYDGKHQIYKVSFNDNYDDYYSKKIPTGSYDEKILCADCDSNILGKYETYASMIIYGGPVKVSEKPSFQRMINQFGLESMRITNIDYKNFKLFLLSILWRASITSQILFKDVKLGKDTEEKVRLMLLNDNAGNFYEIPCIIMTFTQTSLHADLISAPRKDVNRTRFHFAIGGIIYTYIISDIDKHKKMIDEFALNKNNEVHFIYLPEGKAKKFMNSYLGFELYQ